MTAPNLMQGTTFLLRDRTAMLQRAERTGLPRLSFASAEAGNNVILRTHHTCEVRAAINHTLPLTINTAIPLIEKV